MTTGEHRPQSEILDPEALRCRVLRWAVGTPAGPRGSVWRLWGNRKGDAYLAARTSGEQVKASFHRDGRCHIGFTAEYAAIARARFTGLTTRHWERWRLPDDSPALRLVDIVLPHSELRVFEDKWTAARDVQWLHPPAQHAFSVVSVGVAPRNAAVKLPASPDCPETAVAAVDAGHRVLWVFHRYYPVDAARKEWLEQQRQRICAYPGTNTVPRTPSARVMAWGEKPGHERFILDLAWSDIED